MLFWGVFITSALATHYLNGGETLWVLSFIFGMGANMAFRHIYPRKPEVKAPPPPPEPEEDVHAKAAQEERARKDDKPWSPPPRETAAPGAFVKVSPSSIRNLRNLLMRHHEMKRLDASYQASPMCKDTNDIISQLNGLIKKYNA